MADWAERTDIVEVAAGNCCIMARTEDGRVLRKCNAGGKMLNTCSNAQYGMAGSFTDGDPELAGWTDIRQLSLSWEYPGLALGVRNDGTVAALLPLKRTREDLASIISTVSGWEDIAEVSAVNDLFALTTQGRVLQWTFPERLGLEGRMVRHEYERCKTWSRIDHIRGGLYAICGLSEDVGYFSCPWDALLEEHNSPRLFSGVIDLMETGSDDEGTLIVDRAHVLKVIHGDQEHVLASGVERIVGQLFCVLALTTERKLIPVFIRRLQTAEALEWEGVTSAAVGFTGYSPDTVYVIALADDR